MPENPQSLELGTYEIIRGRLQKQNANLQQRLSQLNESRKTVFGAVETTLIANDHIATENNCIAREIVALGNKCIFGYNVHIGLKSQIELSDVFSVFEFRDHSFHKIELSLLEQPAFINDFQNLYRYYRNTVFAKFLVKGAYLYMCFQTGKTHKDIKVFKWLIEDETLTYIDDRSAAEFIPPSQHEFGWTRTGRNQMRAGKYPHISILDRLFVESMNGDITIKIEDNTETGKGIFSEEVEMKDQTLDDADFYYADLGNIIALKIRPYREEFRYYLYNTKVQEVKRVDSIQDAAVLLPESQGLIFSNGYYLQTGEFKLFDKTFSGIQFEQRIISPNGEDYLFVFYQPELDEYVLMPYNIIQQKVETPILCNGYTCFPNGELCYFRAENDPTKHHVIQIWQTPYTENGYLPNAQQDSYLFKVGNKDIVRAMSECYEVITLLNKEDSYANLYLDLVKKTTNVMDAYYWISHEEGGQLNIPLQEIKNAAVTAIDEYEKVQRIKAQTKEAVDGVNNKAEDLFKRLKKQRYNSVDQYVKALAEIRQLRGETISLKELRYIDTEWVDALEVKLGEQSDVLSEKCIEFLLKDDALKPYHEKVNEKKAAIDAVQKVIDAEQLEKDVDEIGGELELLIDIVSNLKITDATHTTQIIDNISGIFIQLNQLRAKLKNRKKDLRGTEANAEFQAQIKLLEQSIINYLDLCDKPVKCDEYLTKLMVSLEELEGKFVDFDEFTTIIYDKRTAINNAFESKKLQLEEQRNRRAANLQNAAERIFKGVKNKLKGFKEVSEINAYFAADLMIDKVRDIIKQLTDLEDTVKADDLQSQLNSIKEEAIRQLKDKKELFVDGANVIKFGKHHFSVNVQPLNLTTVLRNDALYFHLTGTNFFEKIKDTTLVASKAVWKQSLISENQQIYRSEYLAYLMMEAFKDKMKELDLPKDQLLAKVQEFMAPRYQDAYVKGVNDQDAALILQSLVQLNQTIDLLRYPPIARACAILYWEIFENEAEKAVLNHQLKGTGMLLKVFPDSKEYGDLLQELQKEIADFIEETQLFDPNLSEQAAEYLFHELTRSNDFIISPEAAHLYKEFQHYLTQGKHLNTYEASLKNLNEQASKKYILIRNWLLAFIKQEQKTSWLPFVEEGAALLLIQYFNQQKVVHSSTSVTVTDLNGSHNLIQQGKYQLEYNAFMNKMRAYFKEIVPLFEQFTEHKKVLTEQYAQQMRLNEFKPRVLSSFVRNQLIDQLYLNIIGDNLAKQIGVVGDQKRTDLMGMLLLISPPGYGKTTLMEYICSRLGLIFMKINGPAIGHNITSLDPSEAKNAAAREELKKLNLAFEMGDNVMIYVDDIQHCNPEFLQKFISLCDGQRKVEGVYNGVSKTYDLRGKRVCVVMAGNPYTESGDKFTIPDMLANRADTYNLGDIIGDSGDLFKLSYIENCLTSNAILNRLSNKSMKDVLTLIRVAETGQQDGIEFEADHSPEELKEYINVLEKLLVVRNIVLRVNLEYIKSAAQEDQYRTEPPFKLQGSYRDMNKLAEKVVPIMNEKELNTLIISHYISEAQTLTTGAEANLLKFKEINDLLTDEEKERWKIIKETFGRHQLLNGKGIDRMGQLVGQLTAIAKGLDGYSNAFIQGLERISSKLER